MIDRFLMLSMIMLSPVVSCSQGYDVNAQSEALISPLRGTMATDVTSGPPRSIHIDEQDNPEHLKNQGLQLRSAIESAYKHLKAAPRADPGNPTEADVSDVLLRFIPLGTTVSNAESILRYAGFTVRRELAKDASVNASNIVVASIQPFERHLLWTYHSSIRALLTTTDASDEATVQRVFARFKFPEI